MDRQYIETNHIVDRYLLGQLRETEAAEFEAFYFEHADVFEEVQIQKAMHESLAKEMRPPKSELKQPAAGRNWLDLFFPLGVARPVAAALAIALIALSMQNLSLQDQASLIVLSDVQTVVLTQVRGDTVPVVELPADLVERGIRLSMNLGPIGYSGVDLQISKEGDNWSWSEPVTIDPANGGVELIIPPGALQRGTYRLTVRTLENNDFPPLAEYVFQITD